MDDLFGDVLGSGSSSSSSSGPSTAPSSAPAPVEEEYESALFVARECFVYKLPPRTATAGYKAGEWGDMEAFLWKGRCRIIEQTKGTSSKITVQLEDSSTGELFAQCPVDKSGKAVEPVLDSSRYFVLKVVDVNSGKHAYLGMGFQERSEAFDFQVALQDWQKRQRVPKLDPSSDSDSASSAASSPHSGPKRDFSLKAGETISVKIGGGIGGPTKKSGTRNEAAGGAIPLLAPPPPAGRKR